jgi:predicted transcriptional regulator
MKWLLVVVALLSTGCGGLLQGLAPEYRAMESNAMAHGFQTASFVYGFADGGSRVWLKTVEKMRVEGLVLLAALKDGGQDMRLELRDFDSNGRASATAYELVMHLGEHALPGKPGTDPAEYEAALERAAAATGIDATTIKNGHFALYAVANGMTALNAAHDTLKDHAFKLLVLRAKLTQGQTQVDWFDPNRPQAESLADIHSALQLIEDEHRRIRRQRTSILAMIALSQSYRQPSALDLLNEQLIESKGATVEWQATHDRPTADDYGVVAAKLPTIADIKQHLMDKLGFLGTLAQVAEAVVTASPTKAIDALAALAPEDSSAKTALEGLAAATKGDVMGTIEAIAELAGESETFDTVKKRLDQVKDVVDTVKSF